MKLYVCCKNCKKEFDFKGGFDYRQEITFKKGSTFTLQCTDCRRRMDYSANDVYAAKNKHIWIFLAATVVVSYIALLFILEYTLIGNYIKSAIFSAPVALALPYLIYCAYEKEEDKKIRIFNKS